MKHNTHIYLAAKAIEFTYKGVDNMRYINNRSLTTNKKKSERYEAKHRQRILLYYKRLTSEASWAPDYVLHDNNPYHIFKLFTDEEFPDHGLTHLTTFKQNEDDDVIYYKFSGGLPFRIDHIARTVISMNKLRTYNDQFTLRQLMYHYLLLSHYIADAHVPMHCDIRDDPPKQGSNQDPSRSNKPNKPKPYDKYMDSSAHPNLEELWDQAVTPIAIKEEVIKPIKKEEDEYHETEYSKSITFKLNDCRKNGDIKVYVIPERGLMDFIIEKICIQSKIRCQKLFPLDDPKTRNDSILKDITREIFADCIGNLMSIWAYIWTRHQD